MIYTVVMSVSSEVLHATKMSLFKRKQILNHYFWSSKVSISTNSKPAALHLIFDSELVFEQAANDVFMD